MQYLLYMKGTTRKTHLENTKKKKNKQIYKGDRETDLLVQDHSDQGACRGHVWDGPEGMSEA